MIVLKLKSVYPGFELTSEAVVAKLTISYRMDPTIKYKSLVLKKAPNLRYVGILVNPEKIEYSYPEKP